MADPVKLKITKQGFQSALNAQLRGIKISLDKVKYSSTNFVSVPNDDRTTIGNIILESSIAAGGISTSQNTLRLMTLVDASSDTDVASLGIYTDDGVLFAVASAESGTLLKIPSSLSFVMSFGMTVNSFVLEGINIVIDQNTALAMALILEHENHPDPHPQYALKTQLSALERNLLEQIDDLMGMTELFFPPLMQAQYSPSGSYSFVRKETASYSFANTKVAFLLTPEGAHEAWGISRSANQIDASIFDRSGTSRVGYGGRVNYLAIDTDRELIKRGYKRLTDQLDNEIKTGVIKAGDALSIVKGGNEALSYTSADVVLLMTPEGAHEGWSINRAVDKFTIDIYNRSGTGRVGYGGGNVNYMLLKKKSAPTNLSKYPNCFLAGLGSGNTVTVAAPANVNFTNPSYMIHITPEGGHEAWTIARYTDRFVINTYHRSGTSRVGYGGNVNWAVFLTEEAMRRIFFTAAESFYTVPAGKKVRFDVFGAGGAGGGSIWDVWDNRANGADGVLSSVGPYSFYAPAFVAGGGKGGVRGVFDSGSALINGANGAGGVNIVPDMFAGAELIANINGNIGIVGSRYEPQVGGLATSVEVYPDRSNQGGNGALGVGSDRRGYGGAGGSGGYIAFEYENTTSEGVVFLITAGAGGAGYKGTSGGNASEDGGAGFVAVTELN
ncbi:hypothetical protein [Acinetobacter sp. ANC 3813]|uniref:hypothetical protein n=1 Tax=Acinetobacter sp. ANC 3813 TaxID=1977873 RepID=UPI000A34C81D|nr:hypothetical protein [Acinetobacter sp. ANC 3813]OTG87895.1 hypothetical protein B9T34_16305 [Acinetobacter sp. ANC 3813]